jgi:2-keto-4-pentenoate hydratase/2-oxohepta-3-ene-1,7-dioic acid hydratase in catechol pathway
MRALGLIFIARTAKPKMAGGVASLTPILGPREVLGEGVIALWPTDRVGLGFNPPRFLKAGDEVSISISGIGTLTNRFG